MADRSSGATSSQSQKAAKGWNGQLNSLLGINERAFRAWARGMSSITEEVNRFAQARLREDTETWQVLAAARSPMDAFECQRRYAEKVASQYFEEAGKLSQIAMSVASEGFSSLQSELTEASLSPLS
jgi:phasin family protein